MTCLLSAWWPSRASCDTTHLSHKRSKPAQSGYFRDKPCPRGLNLVLCSLGPSHLNVSLLWKIFFFGKVLRPMIGRINILGWFCITTRRCRLDAAWYYFCVDCPRSDIVEN